MKMLGSTNGDTNVGFTGRNGFKDRYGLIGLGASWEGTAPYPAELESSPGETAARFWAVQKLKIMLLHCQNICCLYEKYCLENCRS
jgi:hypothetical protein